MIYNLLLKGTSFLKNILTYSLFVCLFGVFRPTREFFTYMETSPWPVKGLQILTYPLHSWQLSSKVSLAYHTYCDTGHTFIMAIPKDSRYSRILPRVWQWSYDLGLLRLEFEHPTFRMQG